MLPEGGAASVEIPGSEEAFPLVPPGAKGSLLREGGFHKRKENKTRQRFNFILFFKG